MEFAGPRVNIAIEVQQFERMTASIAEYEGRVIAPPHMAGKLVRIQLSNHNVWKYITMLEDAKKAPTVRESQALRDQAEAFMHGLGFPNEASFSKGTDTQFNALKDNGTIALFQSCRREAVEAHDVDDEELYDEDGDELEPVDDSMQPEVWGSWIGERVGVYPGTNVLHGMCRVNVKEREGIKPQVSVDVLYTPKARLITNANDLKAFFSDFLMPKIDGYENNANCLIRIRQRGQDSSADMICFWAYVARESVKYIDQRSQERRFMIPASLERTWQEAVVDGVQSSGLGRVLASALGLPVGEMGEEHQQYAKELAEGLRAGTHVVEAIPGQRHRVIGDAVSLLPRHQMRLQTTVDACTIMEGDKKVVGFYPMMLVMQYGHPESMKHVPQQGGSVVVTRIVFDVDSTAKKLDEIELELDYG